MQDNEIEKFSIIKKDELDSLNYVESLVDAAFNFGLVDENFLNDFQMNQLELLKNRVNRYNGFDSSSISKDKASIISKSNLYTIGIYLKKYTPDEAIEILKSKSLIDIYEIAKKQLERKISVSRVIYSNVSKSTLKTQNETYNDTLIDGMKSFFKIYDPDFNAQDIKITADYILYDDVHGKLIGIEFIEKYLSNIYLENKFCNMFDSKNIERLLYSSFVNYKELIFNIFTVVLEEVIALVLVGEDYTKLYLNQNNLDKLYKLFDGLNEEKFKKVILNAVDKIDFENNDIKDYTLKNINEVISEIYSNYKLNTLENIFIVNRFIGI